MSAFVGTVSAVSRDGHAELFDYMVASICGYGTVANQATGSNVGDGTLTGVDGRASAIDETITLTAQAGGLVFDVVGSVSGAMANANVDHSYDNGFIAFELNSGGIAFDEGDDFVFDVYEGDAKTSGAAWTLIYDSEQSAERKVWLKGDGNSSDDAIYVYLRHFRNTSTGYYNIEMLASVGYDSALAEDPTNQYKASGYEYITLWQNAIDYWLVVNSQRFVLCAKVNTNYFAAYAGWYLPDGLPSEHPLPLFIGANSDDADRLHTDGTSAQANFFSVKADNQVGQFLGFDGVWATLDSNTDVIAPWNRIASLSGPDASNMGVGPNGGYLPMEANIMSSAGGGNSYGILDGVYYISGFNNASENTFIYGSSTYVVIQNIFRTDIEDYMALRLE